jgi:hypothetical protein
MLWVEGKYHGGGGVLRVWFSDLYIEIGFPPSKTMPSRMKSKKRQILPQLLKLRKTLMLQKGHMAETPCSESSSRDLYFGKIKMFTSPTHDIFTSSQRPTMLFLNIKSYQGNCTKI